MSKILLLGVKTLIPNPMCRRGSEKFQIEAFKLGTWSSPRSDYLQLSGDRKCEFAIGIFWKCLKCVLEVENSNKKGVLLWIFNMVGGKHWQKKSVRQFQHDLNCQFSQPLLHLLWLMFIFPKMYGYTLIGKEKNELIFLWVHISLIISDMVS